ncbi:MAG: F0F1 ATP synthase subunit A [Planctomycetota bacterium]
MIETVRTLRALVLAAFCWLAMVGVVVGQDAGAGSGQPQGGDHAAGTMQMDNESFFVRQYEHLVPHPVGAHHASEPSGTAVDHGPSTFTFYNVNLAQVIAIGLMLVVFGAVMLSFRNPGQPGWFVRVFRGFCKWVRDEMVVKVMGEEEGRQFTPFFLYLFFFIAFMNLLGLIPVVGITATACVYVTAAMALVTFLMMVVGGMMKQGVVDFWKHLLPHGLPAWLVPLMIVLELIGLFVKPFALTIRLFANMLAGHLVIYSFIGMIFLFAKMMNMGPVAYTTAAFSVGMGVFISIIEAFVALLQAYIFTFLSIVFVQQARHPAH